MRIGSRNRQKPLLTNSPILVETVHVTIQDDALVIGQSEVLVEYDPYDLAAQGKSGVGPLPASEDHEDLIVSDLQPTSQTNLTYYATADNDRWSLWWKHDASSIDINNDYIYFTVASPGYLMMMDELSVHLASWSGASNLSIRTSADNFVGSNNGNWDKMGIAGWSKQTFDLSSVSSSDTVEVRIYVWGSSDTNSSGWHDVWAGDGVRLTGARIEIPIDVQAPVPDLPRWLNEPYPSAFNAISMRAETSLDQNGVEYYFQCVSGPGSSSGWQDSETYTDSGLIEDVQYAYAIQVRDKSANMNTTETSTSASTVIDLYGGEKGLTDLAALAEQWGLSGCGYCVGTDLTGDGNVDFADLRVMAGNWLGIN
jgi:hypothetical protein